jgi:hypothetical protein
MFYPTTIPSRQGSIARPIYQDTCVIRKAPGDHTSLDADSVEFIKRIQTQFAKDIVDKWIHNTNFPPEEE